VCLWCVPWSFESNDFVWKESTAGHRLLPSFSEKQVVYYCDRQLLFSFHASFIHSLLGLVLFFSRTPPLSKNQSRGVNAASVVSSSQQPYGSSTTCLLWIWCIRIRSSTQLTMKRWNISFLLDEDDDGAAVDSIFIIVSSFLFLHWWMNTNLLSLRYFYLFVPDDVDVDFTVRTVCC